MLYYSRMIVYRYFTYEELKDILADRVEKIGTVYNTQRQENTHKYKPNVRYLHFFKHLRDFPVIQKFASSPEGRFIGKFDIPLRKLLSSKGKGFYDNLQGGYDYGAEQVKEFAVEASKIHSEYLVDFVFDKDCNMTVDEVKQAFYLQNYPERG